MARATRALLLAALGDVFVVLDAEIGEVTVVAVADTGDHELVDRFIVEPGYATPVMQRGVLLEIYIDGIMGINFFEIGRVGINYRQKRIRVWPNDNARHWRYVNLDENLVRQNENVKNSAVSNQR